MGTKATRKTGPERLHKINLYSILATEIFDLYSLLATEIFVITWGERLEQLEGKTEAF